MRLGQHVAARVSLHMTSLPLQEVPCFIVKTKQMNNQYVLAKSHGQAEQGSYLVAHSCAARFVYLSASHFCSVKNGTLQFWNSILLYIGLYVAKFVFSLRLVPLPLVTSWRRKSVRRWFQNSAEFYPSFIWHHFRDSLDHFHGGSDFVRSNSLSKSACHPSTVLSTRSQLLIIISCRRMKRRAAVSWTPSNWATGRTRFWRALSTLRCRMNGTAWTQNAGHFEGLFRQSEVHWAADCGFHHYDEKWGRK